MPLKMLGQAELNFPKKVSCEAVAQEVAMEVVPEERVVVLRT